MQTRQWKQRESDYVLVACTECGRKRVSMEKRFAWSYPDLPKHITICEDCFNAFDIGFDSRYYFESPVF